MNAVPTPIPWQANGNGIHTPRGECIALTHREPKAQRDADAILIVKAVNCHDELVAVLTRLLADTEESRIESAPVSQAEKQARRMLDRL